MATTSWQGYEEAARRVIGDLRAALGLAKMEGKQTLLGASGTDWEVDAKAWKAESVGFVMIEVRRRTSKRLDQESLAAVAYRLEDIGAGGGIVVSPRPLQKGAQLVAAHNNIVHVTVSADSTTERYMAEFLGQRFFGATASESGNAQDTSSAVVAWAAHAAD